MLHFQAIIQEEPSSKGTYVETPIDADIEKLFGHTRPKIKATFDGKAVYRGTLTRMKSAQHFVLLRKDMRSLIGKKAGDTVEVLLELDKEPRIMEVPEFIQTKLDENPTEAEFFKGLSYTCQKEYITYVTEAKKEETRQNRLQKMIAALQTKSKTINGR